MSLLQIAELKAQLARRDARIATLEADERAMFVKTGYTSAEVLADNYLKVKSESAAERKELLDELRNIANADTVEWDDRSEFEAWAKSRARAAIAKAVQP